MTSGYILWVSCFHCCGKAMSSKRKIEFHFWEAFSCKTCTQPAAQVNPVRDVSSWGHRIGGLFFMESGNHNWLVVSTPLKNISQLGWLFPIYGKIKNVPNHHPVTLELRLCLDHSETRPRSHGDSCDARISGCSLSIVQDTPGQHAVQCCADLSGWSSVHHNGQKIKGPQSKII